MDRGKFETVAIASGDKLRVETGYRPYVTKRNFIEGAMWAYDRLAPEIERQQKALEVLFSSIEGSNKFDEDSGVHKWEHTEPDFQRYKWLVDSVKKAREILGGGRGVMIKKLTIKDIRDLNPCYDPSVYLSEDWTGTVLYILEMDNVPAADRIWVVLRLIDRFTVEVFALDCAFAANSYAIATASAASAASAAAYAAAANSYATASAAAYAYAAASAAASAAHYVAYSADVYSADAYSADAYSAAYAAAEKERERQIDALIFLINKKAREILAGEGSES
jgi:hypothetical protein